MTLSLFLLSTLFLPSASQQGEPGVGVPHPSYPVPGFSESREGWSPWDGRRWWVELQPSWKEQYSFLEEDLRHALLERVAGAIGAPEAAAFTWADSTRPQALALNFRILVDGAEALVGREYLKMGQAVALSDLVRKAGILDFDVEIASGSGIFDPFMGQQYSGSSLALQVLPLPGKGWSAELAMVHSERIQGEAIEFNYAQVDGKFRLIQQVAEAGGHVLLLPDAATTIDLPNLGPGKLSLELQADSPAPAGPQDLMEELVWLSLPTLARSDVWARAVSTWDQEARVWSNGQGDLLFHGPTAKEVANRALALAESQSKPMQVDLRVQRIVQGVEGERSDLRAKVFEDTPLRFAQGTLRDALTEWDVEVAQVARIADPVFANFFSGWKGNLTGRRLAAGSYEVDVDLRFSTVDIGPFKHIRLAAATPGEQGYDGNVPASPAQNMAVETPEVREVRFHGTYRTDMDGRLVLIRSANSVLGEGGRLRIELQLAEG
ncbi:MAG: hypothetical protein ACYSU1_01605 [Planctomycetota bacterium]|jgi:hypothetical protein